MAQKAFYCLVRRELEKGGTGSARENVAMEKRKREKEREIY